MSQQGGLIVENTISNLLSRYESGTLTRRELIKAMAMVAAAGAGAEAAMPQANPGFVGSAIEHISLHVSDLKRSRDFYQKTFGLSVMNEASDAIRLGPGRIMVVLRPGNRPGLDHLTIGIDNASKESVIQDLKRRGATVLDGGEANLHVKDPDGLIVEIIANDRSWR
jgi:catechol 2,3-dioxygenase-like lactoylglutathione lyase family enzyme